jgi:cytochrome c peroxidase
VARDYRAQAAENVGKHRTPSLRNVDKRPRADFVKAYGHNGYFKSLAQIVSFYDTRDALPACDAASTPGAGCWPEAEVAANVDTRVGNLGLTAAQGAALVAFLRTLDDGFVPPAP